MRGDVCADPLRMTDTDVDEPVEEPTAVMTGPQVRAFLAGVDAGMGWVIVVAREVRDAGQVTA